MTEVSNHLLPFIVIVLLIVYLSYLSVYSSGLLKLTKGNNLSQESVTVIIAARNEEHTIGKCLESLCSQKYPRDNYSIIVVDDGSIDATREIIERYGARHSPTVRLISISDRPAGISPKINALSQAMKIADGSIIMTTDADCVVTPEWISSTMRYFDENTGVVTGVTTYDTHKAPSPVFGGMQFLDFISYTAVGAGAIGNGNVILCNGSNMAFRRKAFDEAGGFASLKHLNTGDDSLLGQLITRSKKWSGRFNIDPEAAVTTYPVSSVGEFFSQRMRWAGQTTEYPAAVLFFMICSFLMFTILFFWIPVSLFVWSPLPWTVLVVKSIVDYNVMKRFCTITHTDRALKYFIPTAVIHIPVILVSVVGGFFLQFRWKDQTVRRTAA